MTCRSLVLQQQRSSHLPVRNNLGTNNRQCHQRKPTGFIVVVFLCNNVKWEAHLTQCTFQFPQKIIVRQIVGVVVNIVHAKLQPLHHLKIVVDYKLLGKLWIQTVQDHLSAGKLVHKKEKKKNRSHAM